MTYLYYQNIREKNESIKKIGKRWGKLYGILMKIHEEIDPIIQKQNEALENLMPEIRD